MMSVPVYSPVESKLVTPVGALPLVAAALRVAAQGGTARVVLEQTFANHHPDPLSVTYVMPLPADAAVSGFSFRIGDRLVVGEVDKKRAARERYEDAIARGQTAALLEQDRSSLFTQEIGNVPPGEKVVCEIVLDQRLRWLDEGSWELRFPLAAAPRYLGAPGRVADAEKIALEVVQTLRPRASLAMSIGDVLVHGRSPESPSHPLQCTAKGNAWSVELGSNNQVELDRDVVVRWPVAALAPTLSVVAEESPAGAHALFTIVPPQPGTARAAVARDLVVLLDTSGSMHGAPLDQARRVAMALIDGLADRDSIELIEFGNQPRRMWKTPIWATKENKAYAMKWLAALQASGGTEMREGILEALRPLRADAQRQIILVTDGLIGFEQEIVETILARLPAGSRVHTVGVGSSVNRSLTGPAARAGKGIEVVIGLGEDPERAAQRLRSRTEAPVVVDVTLEGAALVEHAPAKIPDLYAGAPVLAAAKLRPEGGEIIVRGRTEMGPWEQRVQVAPNPRRDDRPAIAALFAREAVEDLETKLAAGAERHAIDRAVEDLGVRYQIATRLTSWIAVDKKVSVDPLAPARKEVMPQMLPYGMSVDGFGLRTTALPLPPPAAAYIPSPGMIMPQSLGAPLGGMGGAPPAPARGRAAFHADAEDGFAEEEAEQDVARTIAREEAAPTPKPAAEKAKKVSSTGAPPPPLGAAPPRTPAPLLRSPLASPAPFGRAKLVRREGREVTIEITMTAPFAWDPTTFVALVLADGVHLAGRVELAKTTRAASLVAGQVVRLVVVLDLQPSAAPVEVELANATFALT